MIETTYYRKGDVNPVQGTELFSDSVMSITNIKDKIISAQRDGNDLVIALDNGGKLIIRGHYSTDMNYVITTVDEQGQHWVVTFEPTADGSHKIDYLAIDDFEEFLLDKTPVSTWLLASLGAAAIGAGIIAISNDSDSTGPTTPKLSEDLLNKLATLVGVAEGIDPTIYTPDSLAGLEDALELAKGPHNSNADLQNAIDALENALDGLKLDENKNGLSDDLEKQLEDLIGEINSLDKTDFTDESVADLTAELDKVKDQTFENDGQLQEAIDNLNDKLNQLQPKVPNEDDTNKNGLSDKLEQELADLIGDIENLDKTDFTDESVADLTAELDKVKDQTFENDAQLQDAIDNLKDKVEQLQPKAPNEDDVNKNGLSDKLEAELAELLESVNKLNSDLYTEESVKSLKDLATEIATTDFKSDAQLQSAIDQLKEKFDSLVSKAPTDDENGNGLSDSLESKLQELLDQKEKLDSNDFTAESWKDVEDAYNQATGELDNDIELQNAIDNLEKALEDLVGRTPEPQPEPIDTQALNEAIAKAINLDYSKYTPESVIDYKLAVTNAVSKQGSFTSQEEVDQLLKAIVDAESKFVEVDTPIETPEVSETELTNLIKVLFAKDLAGFTADSVEEFNSALGNAIAKLGTFETQEEVEAEISKLLEAESNLVALPVIPEEYTELQKQIDALNELNEAAFTPETWEILEQVKQAFESVDIQDVDAIKNISSQLESAVNGLEVKEPTLSFDPDSGKMIVNTAADSISITAGDKELVEGQDYFKAQTEQGFDVIFTPSLDQNTEVNVVASVGDKSSSNTIKAPDLTAPNLDTARIEFDAPVYRDDVEGEQTISFKVKGLPNDVESLTVTIAGVEAIYDPKTDTYVAKVQGNQILEAYNNDLTSLPVVIKAYDAANNEALTTKPLDFIIKANYPTDVVTGGVIASIDLKANSSEPLFTSDDQKWSDVGGGLVDLDANNTIGADIASSTAAFNFTVSENQTYDLDYSVVVNNLLGGVGLDIILKKKVYDENGEAKWVEYDKKSASSGGALFIGNTIKDQFTNLDSGEYRLEAIPSVGLGVAQFITLKAENVTVHDWSNGASVDSVNSYKGNALKEADKLSSLENFDEFKVTKVWAKGQWFLVENDATEIQLEYGVLTVDPTGEYIYTPNEVTENIGEIEKFTFIYSDASEDKSLLETTELAYEVEVLIESPDIDLNLDFDAPVTNTSSKGSIITTEDVNTVNVSLTNVKVPSEITHVKAAQEIKVPSKVNVGDIYATIPKQVYDGFSKGSVVAISFDANGNTNGVDNDLIITFTSVGGTRSFDTYVKKTTYEAVDMGGYTSYKEVVTYLSIDDLIAGKSPNSDTIIEYSDLNDVPASTWSSRNGTLELKNLDDGFYEIIATRNDLTLRTEFEAQVSDGISNIGFSKGSAESVLGQNPAKEKVQSFVFTVDGIAMQGVLTLDTMSADTTYTLYKYDEVTKTWISHSTGSSTDKNLVVGELASGAYKIVLGTPVTFTNASVESIFEHDYIVDAEIIPDAVKGNIFSNDTFNKTLTNLSVKDGPEFVEVKADTVIVGKYGTLVLSPNGNYTYTLNADVDTDALGKTDTFVYKLTGVGNDNVETKLNINIGSDSYITTGKGDTDVVLHGNEYDNIFVGNEFSNIIKGNGGNDTVIFTLLDKLDSTGGNGHDYFTDFTVGISAGDDADSINVSQLLSLGADDDIKNYIGLNSNKDGGVTITIDRDGEGDQYKHSDLITFEDFKTQNTVVNGFNDSQILDLLLQNGQIIY